jgi:hypothetical protein
VVFACCWSPSCQNYYHCGGAVLAWMATVHRTCSLEPSGQRSSDTKLLQSRNINMLYCISVLLLLLLSLLQLTQRCCSSCRLRYACAYMYV